jgi:hypothetical protein
MKHVLLIVGALLAGFAGGTLGTRMTRSAQTRPEQIVRARRFELVDETGKAISYWGIDKRNYLVLAFGRYVPKKPAGGGGARSSPPELEDPNNQRATLGVIDDSPMLELRGADGEIRMMVNLSIYDKPIIWMADETGKRLSLGVEHTDTPSRDDSDWALDFAPDRARIGMFTVEEGGQRYVRGLFDVNRERAKFPYRLTK